MTITLTTPSVLQARRVERLIAGQPTSDGAGVKLTRVLTQDLQRRLDPFLMLDASAATTPTTTSPVSPTTRTAASRPSPT